MIADAFELVGVVLAFLLTLSVLTYLIGDNPLFRLASHLFIGVSAGYVSVLVIYNVIWLRLVLPFWKDMQAGVLNIPAVVAILAGFWLLLARSRTWGRPVMAYLVGVGAAAALGGALFYTVYPQIEAAAAPFESSPTVDLITLITGSIALVGTAATLVYFNFHGRQANDLSVRRTWWVEVVSWVGQFFVAVTFGVLFASVYIAALTAFIDRIKVIWDGLWVLFSAIPLG